MTAPSTVKMTKYKVQPFEHTVSMSKMPTGSVYLGNIIIFLIYLHDTFPMGLELDLEGSSRFPAFVLLMQNNRLSLFFHL